MASYSGAGHVPYEPLPSTTDEQTSNFPSPGPTHTQFDLSNTPYHSNPPSSHDLISGDPNNADSTFDIPPGAAQPRFLGAALYSDSGLRHSYSSSQNSIQMSSSAYHGSVYALDPNNETMGYRDDPRNSYQPEQYGMAPLSPGDRNRFLEKKNVAYANPREKARSKMRFWVIVATIAILLLVAAVVVYFLVIKPKTHASSSTSKTSTATSATPTSTSTPKTNVAITGGDGSTVTMDDGSTFVYHNSFGGYWYYDPNDPFNNGARPQSWSPALNETFQYGVDQIRGVNLGGWLVTEPFIAPALYQKYSSNPTPPVDEWTLTEAMTADTAGGGISQLETHYQTFITEQDFAEIAAAGLNFVRIPLGYWAIEVRDGEEFYPQVSWTYFLKAIKWARKYGLRINLDFHALPGSQNGWNHSGRLGTIGVLNGPMGYANAQRSLDYIRIIAEFISQPQYQDVVTIFGIMNEPQGGTMGQENLSRFYLRAYEYVRNAGGTGAGNGPYVSIHDGFFSRSDWVGVFPDADRLAIDTHPYIAFGTQSAGPMSSFVSDPCTWGADVNTSMSAFGLTTAGEFSNAVNDCGLYLNNVGAGTRYEGTYATGETAVGNCSTWLNYQSYNDSMKTSIRQFALSSMDALQDYFFWTWKIGNSSTSGIVEAPAWSYQLGLQQGWMPTDPREAIGACGNTSPWNPPLQSWQTGGAGIGIPSSVSSSIGWPPTTISDAGSVSTLPFYTPTGTIPTLAVPTFTNSINAGDGWENPSDTAGMHVPIATCTYLNPWVDPGTAPPASCGGAAVARRADLPLITPGPTP